MARLEGVEPPTLCFEGIEIKITSRLFGVAYIKTTAILSLSIVPNAVPKYPWVLVTRNLRDCFTASLPLTIFLRPQATNPAHNPLSDVIHGELFVRRHLT